MMACSCQSGWAFTCPAHHTMASTTEGVSGWAELLRGCEPFGSLLLANIDPVATARDVSPVCREWRTASNSLSTLFLARHCNVQPSVITSVRTSLGGDRIPWSWIYLALKPRIRTTVAATRPQHNETILQGQPAPPCNSIKFVISVSNTKFHPQKQDTQPFVFVRNCISESLGTGANGQLVSGDTKGQSNARWVFTGFGGDTQQCPGLEVPCPSGQSILDPPFRIRVTVVDSEGSASPVTVVDTQDRHWTLRDISSSASRTQGQSLQDRSVTLEYLHGEQPPGLGDRMLRWFLARSSPADAVERLRSSITMSFSSQGDLNAIDLSFFWGVMIPKTSIKTTPVGMDEFLAALSISGSDG